MDQVSANPGFNFFPARLVATVVNATILIELRGISMAAITGIKFPVTAKARPITL